MKIRVIGFILTLFLAFVLGIAFAVQPASGEGTIYIQPDGSVSPLTAPILKNGDSYILTDNIFNTTIMILKDNITLNGNGHLLQELRDTGSTFGIDLTSRRNVTVTNTVVSGFSHDFWLDFSCHNRIVNNTVLCAQCDGIRLYESHENILENNIVVNSSDGIRVHHSNFNILRGNTIKESYQSIMLTEGTQNMLRNNTMIDNQLDLEVGPYFLTYYMHDIDTSNTVDGKPIYYWINRCNETVPSDAGHVVVVNCSEIIVKNMQLRNTIHGVTLAHTKTSLIENITATKNEFPIVLDHSYSNTISRSNLCDSTEGAIRLVESSLNNVTYNTIRNTTGYAISVESAQENMMVGNNVIDSHYGFEPQGLEGTGILISNSRDCKIVNNTVIRSIWGIVIGVQFGSGNVLSGNNVASNDVGLLMQACSGNVIYRNNFIGNKLQVLPLDGAANFFDQGYPLGGNHWSDYSCIDNCSGEFQNTTGSDGIGDTPYTIDENNRDLYPLIAPSIPVPIVWNESLYQIGLESNSTISGFCFNESRRTISFNVSGPEYSIGYCNATIPSRLIHDAWQDNYVVLIDGELPSNMMNWTDDQNTYLFFTYRHSMHEVVIVPEFSLLTILSYAMAIATLAVAMKKKARLQHQPFNQ